MKAESKHVLYKEIIPVMMGLVLVLSLVMASRETVGWEIFGQLNADQLEAFLHAFIWNFFLLNVMFGLMLVVAIFLSEFQSFANGRSFRAAQHAVEQRQKDIVEDVLRSISARSSDTRSACNLNGSKACP